MPIALRVPQRHAPAPDLEVRPRAVRKWIESLALNVTFETGRRLRTHLAATNRATLDPGDRLQIIEAHREAATKLVADLEPMYARASLPLGPGPRAALGLVRELSTELALGYRIALAEYGGKVFASKRQLAELFSQATAWTAARLFAAYRSYTPVAPETWAELHELYVKAEAEGAHAESADTYRDALLVSLTDPYRLGQGEVDQVLQVLADHRGLATLGQARPRTPPGGHFIVPCNTDKPPKPSIAKLDETGGPDWRLLDANPLVAALRARPKDARAAGLVGRLVRLWGDPPKRASRRDPGQITVAISMGIDGVGHFVSQQHRFDLERQDDMLRRGITMPLAPLPLDAASQPIPVFEWDVVNESRGGLRVRRLGPTDQPIAIGEIAGIKLPGKARWAIGVVRWITVFEDGGMEFGLQYLADEARAVSVKAWGAAPATGLLLAHQEARPASLITPPNAFSHLKELELEDGADALLVHAGDTIEVTHRFELFVIEAG